MNQLGLALLIFLVVLGSCGSGRTQERTLPTGDGYSVRCIAFSPDGTLFVTGHGTNEPSLFARGHVNIWDAKQGKRLGVLKGHGAPVNTLAFSPDGKMIAAAGTTLKIWEIASRKRFLKIPRMGTILSLAFAPDGKSLVTCHGDKAYVWDPTTGKQRTELRGRKGVSELTFSRDGKTLATSSWNNTVILWDTATWEISKTLSVGVRGALIRHSPTNRRLFVSGIPDKPETIWDIEKGEVAVTLKGDSGHTKDAAFSPDGRHLATVDGVSLSIWDVMSGERLALVKGEKQRHGVKAVAFSPDGSLIVIGDTKDDHHTMVRIFEVAGLLEN